MSEEGDMVWRRVQGTDFDAMDCGPYRILKSTTCGLTRYLLFFGKTERGKVASILSSYATFQEAKDAADEHDRGRDK